MARGNFTKNRGPKSLAGRLNQLRGLRNVGIKLATDKQYLDQVYDDGMDFVSKRKKREANKLDAEFTKVVRDNIVKPHQFNKDYNAPKEWVEDYEAKKADHQLSIEEAQRIARANRNINATNYQTGFSTTKRKMDYRRYGYMPGVWLPTPSKRDDDDDWYSNYARKQRPKTYY